MRTRLPFLILRLLALVALAVSTALLLDYVRPVAAFCAPDSGCDKVRLSGYGSLWGIPVPVIGIAGFAAVFVLSFFARAFWLLRLGAIFGGVAGAVFLVLQAVTIQAFCQLCLVVDIASIGIAICTLLADAKPPAKLDAKWVLVWAVAGALSVAFPIIAVQPAPPVPAEIARLWVPGKINVVEFSDFQCPFCKQLHPQLTKISDEYGTRVHLVRLNMPLPMHPQARDAARAYCCADEQGKGTVMADALFSAADLSPSNCERMAASVGVALPEYRACIAGSTPDARIESDVKKVRAAGLRGLPTVWIGEQVHVGWRPGDEPALRSAFERAAHGNHPLRIPLEWFWAGFALVLLALAAFSWRVEPVES